MHGTHITPFRAAAKCPSLCPPGSSPFMDELKYNMAPLRGPDGRLAYSDMLKVGQCHPELVVMDPGDA